MHSSVLIFTFQLPISYYYYYSITEMFLNNGFRFDFGSKYFKSYGSKVHNFNPGHVNIHLEKFRLIL